ncbi:MAG: DUF58 domain-containing protein [Armatimonadota bacterium]|nr:DUF58 domain-containing protein [Armatimonadota bacterium]
MPTREGAAVLLLAVAVFFLATNLMSGLLFVLDALLVSVFVVGAAASLLPVRALRVERSAARRATEGESVALDVTLVSSRGGRLLIVEDGWDGNRRRALVPYVAPGVTTTRLHVTATRRGRVTLGPVVVSSPGPLGMFTACRRIDRPGTVMVWPRLRPVTPQALARIASVLAPAETARRSRHPEDLHGVRDYQPGDEINRIHWRSTARRGALVVREFERPAAPAVTILLDLDRRQSPDRLDAAVRAAASVLHLAREYRAEATLLGWEEHLAECRDWEAAMDWLARVSPCGPPLADVLPAVRGRGRLIAVVSTAAVPRTDGVVWILPADEARVSETRPSGLTYASDGTVQAW